jgi:hypothetical protein
MMGNRSKFRKPPEKKEANSPTDEQKIISIPLIIFMYVLLPTAAIGGLILYYFHAPDSAMRGMAIIVGAWVVLRSFTAAT